MENQTFVTAPGGAPHPSLTRRQQQVTTSNTSSHHQPSPYTVQVQGRSLLVPNTNFSRAVVMGNEQGRNGTGQQQRPLSNLSVLMRQQELAATAAEPPPPPAVVQQQQVVDEADSACDPRREHLNLGSSAPMMTHHSTTSTTAGVIPAAPPSTLLPPSQLPRHLSTGCFRGDRSRRYACLCRPCSVVAEEIIGGSFNKHSSILHSHPHCHCLVCFSLADAFLAKSW